MKSCHGSMAGAVHLLTLAGLGTGRGIGVGRGVGGAVDMGNGMDVGDGEGFIMGDMGARVLSGVSEGGE
jgi:hypothetical protein